MPMRLLTAHKILIGTAAVFFFFFGLWELRNSADEWAIFRGVLYLLVGIGFAVYFKNLNRLYK
jgi:cytochrome c oxidase assembly factor CtaG